MYRALSRIGTDHGCPLGLGTWEVLGHVVSKVFSCWDVCDAELVLTDAIANPVETHIDSR